MLQIERPSCLVAGTRVRGPKFFRFGPRLEGPLALPHAVRGIERIVFPLRPLEQMKFQETRNTIEISIASQPYFFVFQLPFSPPMDGQGTLKGDAGAWYDVTTHIIILADPPLFSAYSS